MDIYKYIKNPLTNRNVRIDGKIGKQVLNQYLNQAGGADELWSEPIAGTILGPFNIEYFRNINSKNIILMGEHHLSLPNNFRNPELRRDDKIWFHNYMLSIINQAQRLDKCVDLYTETKYTIQKFWDEDRVIEYDRYDEEINPECIAENEYYLYRAGYITWLEKVWKNLCIKNKRNLRFHNFNLRETYTTTDSHIKYFNPFILLFIRRNEMLLEFIERNLDFTDAQVSLDKSH